MRALILSLGLAFVSSPSLSTPVTFTGAELAGLPGAEFPTGGQSIVGDGLYFDPTLLNAVLYRLPLNDFITDPNNIGISVNMSRLFNDGGNADQDFRFGIYDGQRIFDTFFIDVATQLQPANRVDVPNASETQNVTNLIHINGPLYSAPIGSIAQLDVTIQAGPTSTTIISEVNQAGAFTSSVPYVLDTAADLSLIFLGNNLGENYLINSLTFTSGVSFPTAVPEPRALAGLALGLGMLGFSFYRRRFV